MKHLPLVTFLLVLSACTPAPPGQFSAKQPAGEPAPEPRLETRSSVVAENVCATVPARAPGAVSAATLNAALSRQDKSGKWSGAVTARTLLYADSPAPIVYFSRASLDKLKGTTTPGLSVSTPTAADPQDSCSGLVIRATLARDAQGLHVAYTVDELDDRPEFGEVDTGSHPGTPHSGLVDRVTGDLRIAADGTGFDAFRYVDLSGATLALRLGVMTAPPAIPELPASIPRASLTPDSVEYDHDGTIDGQSRITIDLHSGELVAVDMALNLFASKTHSSGLDAPAVKTLTLSPEDTAELRKLANKIWLEGLPTQACNSTQGPFNDLKVNAGGYQRRYSSPFLCMTKEELEFRKAFVCAATPKSFGCPGFYQKN